MRAEHKFCVLAALAVSACSRPSSHTTLEPEQQQTPTRVTPAPTPNLRVFEVIELGTPPPSLPQCGEDVPMQPCVPWWREGPGIYLPALQLTNRYSLIVEFDVIDNNVERVWVKSTKRLGADREMLADLEAKYGVPGSRGRDTDTLADIATWDFEGLHVTWSSRSLTSDHGRALIQSTRGRDQAAAERRKIEAATPKL